MHAQNSALSEGGVASGLYPIYRNDFAAINLAHFSYPPHMAPLKNTKVAICAVFEH